MKTTLELPDQLFRKAKATAAERGQSLKEFVTEALRDKLLLGSGRARADEPEWMQGFGKLKRLHNERSEEHTSELQSPDHLVCRLLLEKKKKIHSKTSAQCVRQHNSW